ncbi:MAG: YceI family protein [Planctomycetota bacterium]
MFRRLPVLIVVLLAVVVLPSALVLRARAAAAAAQPVLLVAAPTLTAPTLSAPAAAAALKPLRYDIDPVHSSMVFKVRHKDLANFYGRFNELSGHFVLDEQDAAGSSVEVTVPAESVDSNNEKRDQHLRGPDFFSAKEFPEIVFKSTKVTKVDDTHYDVQGDLTLRGVTKSVLAKAERTGAARDDKGNSFIGFEVTFTIQRSEFDVSYGPGSLGEDVHVIVSLEARAKG